MLKKFLRQELSGDPYRAERAELKGSKRMTFTSGKIDGLIPQPEGLYSTETESNLHSCSLGRNSFMVRVRVPHSVQVQEVAQNI